ncbi:MAG: FtsX-like permease family protein [Cyclobacteriaceae bacterium]
MSVAEPPKWINRLLEKYCAPSELEEVQGDLYEAYQWRLAERGKWRANWLFIIEALRMLHLHRNRSTHKNTMTVMLYRHYFKTGFRFLKKNSLYATFNIIGLALGISFCWVAYLYTQDEMSYDQYLPEHEKMYRIVMDFQPDDQMEYIGGSSHAMSVTFEESIPEIAKVVKLQTGRGMILTDREPIRQSYLLADQGLIDVLQLSFIEGTSGAFDQPNDVIISETLASKLNLMGRAADETLSIVDGEESLDVIVRGVYRDIPLNTSVRSDMIISYANYVSRASERRLTSWFDINMNTIIQLHDAGTKSSVEQKMNGISQASDDELGNKATLGLQPLSEIHLDNAYGHYNGIARGGNVGMMKLFAAIGLFCLVISMINYANFNISLYTHRTREVALRKVLGAQRSGIFYQFITESILSCLIAGVLALVILLLILPYFSDFVSKHYDLSYLINFQFMGGAAFILFATAIISGVYPALVLSKFAIVKSLKGEQKIGAGSWITQALLGVQFIIATALIAGVLTMNDQVNYLSNFDTKVNYDNVIYLDNIPGEEPAIRQFVTAVNQMSEVSDVAAISGYNGTRITEGDYQFGLRHLRVHGDLINLLDISLVEGRNFRENIISDKTQSIIVNRAFVKSMNLKQPIGAKVPFNYGDLESPTIIGVVEDYLFLSAKNKVEPLVIYQSEEYPLQSAYIKLNDNASFDKEKLETAWRAHFDPFPFEHSLLEDYYQLAYAAERQMIQLVGLGCMVAIFLAAMGLLGIVGLQLVHRLKEISIRKVLGANAQSLYRVTSQGYLRVISLGLIGGLTIAYALINSWLENYPFHIEFGTKIIGISVLITLAIALTTILIQVFKVIRSNPIRYLRNE